MEEDLLKKLSQLASQEHIELPKWLFPEELTEAESEVNETRYLKLAKESNVPFWGLFKAIFEEDRLLVLPRLLSATVKTLVRIPKSLLMRASPEREEYIFDTFRIWSGAICQLLQIRLSVKGAERIDPTKTYLFVSNHRSPADIPVLYNTVPTKAAFVANKIIGQIPIFSYWMKASGAVFVGQGKPKEEVDAFKTMVRRLKQGRTLILFPEGYIHQGPGVGEFKRGGIHAALLANVPIVPTCLFNTEKVIRTGTFHFVPRQNVCVEFGEPIYPDSLSRKEKKFIELTTRAEIAAMRENARRKESAQISIPELRATLKETINKLT